jgi:hypothetical protein
MRFYTLKNYNQMTIKQQINKFIAVIQLWLKESKNDN